MRIDHIKAINLLYRYPPQARFQYAARNGTARVTTLILVHTGHQLAPAQRGAARSAASSRGSLSANHVQQTNHVHRVSWSQAARSGLANYSDMASGREHQPPDLPYVELAP